MAINKKISTLVANHFPDHIVESYPGFIEFIEAYYEWMEQSKQVTNVLKTLLDNQDVDTTSLGSVVLRLGAGSGVFIQDEIVFQGASISTALATGRVLSYENDTLEITNLIGSFNTGFGPINGVESTASYSVTDIDFLSASLNDFIRWFRVEFIPSIPKNMIADSRKFIKHSRQFYKAKGTQKSYRLLFRILFNEEIDFYYPWRDLLRASDAKWIEPRTIRVRSLVGNPFQYIGKRIRGVDSLSSALVEDVVSYNIGLNTIFELTLNRLSISGNFLADENIRLEDSSVISKILPIVQSITITDPGTGYTLNDIIEFQSFTSGSEAQAKIIAIGINGEIENVQMINFGADYDISSPPTILFPPSITPASGVVNLGAVSTYPGFFLNDDSMLNSTKYIQDGHFYQQFSYVLKVNQSIDQYRDIVKKLVHPAGLVFFGELLNIIDLDFNIGFADLAGACSFIEIERQQFPVEQPFDEVGPIDLQQEALYNLLGIENDSSTIIIEQSISKGLTLGPTYQNFDYLHSQHLPYPGSDTKPEIDMTNSENPDYWDNWANYQYSTIGHLVFEDFLSNNGEDAIDILPEPRIEVEKDAPDLGPMILIFDTNLD
jgi:hypothetical protein